jgi:triosephosphate isomerase (TIM)
MRYTILMSFYLVANFKSHQSQNEFQTWLATFTSHAPAISSGVTTILAPSSPHLSCVLPAANYLLCAQDVSPFPPGSYTGATNAKQLFELGVKYCLVGHSERRHYFHETATEIASKIRELHAVGIIPILCLSKEDIPSQLPALDDNDKQNLLVVFEPPADIGGTVTAPEDQITTVTTSLRQLFPDCPVLYGGSVNAGNLAPLLGLVDGVLIASASLDPTQFLACLNIALVHGTTR